MTLAASTKQLNAPELCAYPVHTVMLLDSFCAGAKPIPDRASVHT